MRHAARTLLALSLATPFAFAQQPLAPRPSLDGALAAWRAQYGESWTLALDTQTGWAQMLYGGRAASPSMQPRADADYVALAQAALAQTAALHGLAPSTLVLQDTCFLPLGQIGSGDKQTVRFRQAVGGVPVEGAFLNLLFSAHGELLSLQSTGLPGAENVSTQPALEGADAVGWARAHFLALTKFAALESSQPELVIAQIEDGAQRAGRLAWRIECRWSAPESEPIGRRIYVDAQDGSLLRSDELVHHLDVGGTVSSLATPGTLPDVANNPETAQGVKYGRCTAGATTVYTDANGNFNFPGVSGPLAVTFSFVGTYASVNYQPGTDYTLTQTLSGTGNSVLLNPAAGATITSQANAYIGSTLMRDWIRGLNPVDAHGDFVTMANVSVSGTCNAYYDGVSTNFFPPGGGCVDTSYSTVVSHEQGHWMNDRYGTGNGPDGMGEGNADTWSMYIWDTPVMGDGFFGPGTNVRTGLNTRQFCGDTHPACYGEVHADGEVWMGASWKVRANLNTTLGNAQGDLAANSLFLAWMNAYNQTQIRSIIETQWITLDDDNGTIVDGSPHFADIDAGFRAQGFPGLNACPLISNVCTSTTNSTGLAALMHSFGQNRISSNNLILNATNLPADKTGLFFFGQTQTQVPFGNGWRCVASPFLRLPATTSNLLGDLYWPLNLNTLPGGTVIHAGEVWYFQAWFRDPAAGGAGSNTSDALRVPWCP